MVGAAKTHGPGKVDSAAAVIRRPAADVRQPPSDATSDKYGGKDEHAKKQEFVHSERLTPETNTSISPILFMNGMPRMVLLMNADKKGTCNGNARNQS